MLEDFPLLNREKLMGHPECSVNKKGIHLNKEITVYKCDCTKTEEALICHGCKINCHANHKTVPIEKRKAFSFVCYCAKTDHNPNLEKEKEKEREENELKKRRKSSQISSDNFNNLANPHNEQKCRMEKFYKIFKYDFYYKDRKTNKNFCAFCGLICQFEQNNNDIDNEIIEEEGNLNNEIEMSQDNPMKNNNNDIDSENNNIPDENDILTLVRKFFEKLSSKSKIKSKKLDKFFSKYERIENPLNCSNNKILNSFDNFKCCCTHKGNHSSKEKEYYNLSKIIRKKVFEHLGFNINNFRFAIFDKKNNNNKLNLNKEILESYIENNEKIISHGAKNIHIQEKADFFNEYIAQAKVIEAMGNNYKKANVCFNQQPEYSGFFNSLSIDFLLKIFEQPITQIDQMLIIKKINLRIFRKFYLSPIINSQNFYTDQVDANITPLHRKLSNRDFSNKFFSDINIPKEKFLELLNLMQNCITKYFNEFYTTKSSSDMFKLFKEYLHFLNIVVKYHLNDNNFCENLIISLYNFLKNLFNHQKHAKIYMLKKQVLKLITKFALKNNDEKFFRFMDNSPKKDIEECSFSFQNNEINNMIFKIFLMINYKTYSCQTVDNILTEKIHYFLNLMMVDKNDGFSNNLDNICKNKKFLIDFKKENLVAKDPSQKECIEKVNNLLNKFEQEVVKLYKAEISEAKFIKTIFETFTIINDSLQIYINQNEKKIYKINHFQYLLYIDGYYTKLMHVLVNVRQLSKIIPINILKKNYEIIFKNIQLFSYENPFLALLFVTHKFTKTLFHNEPDYNIALFSLYSKIFKMLNKYSYSIDPRPFFNNFENNYRVENFFCSFNYEKWEDVYHIGSIYDNVIPITNKNIRNIVYQMISEEIKHTLLNQEFFSKLNSLTKKLQKDNNIDSLPQIEKYFIWSFKNFLKILVHLSDGHFIALASNLNIEKLLNIIEEILEIKFLHPNFRRGLICFFTKAKIQLPYKIFKSSVFNERNFQGISENIPYMTKDPEKDFGIDNQKHELELIVNELEIFPENINKHEKYFKEHKTAFFKYFSEGIFMPCMNCMYKVMYFNDKINSSLKYLTYKILVLFEKCFYFFLEKIEAYNFYDPFLFLDYLCIDVGLGQKSKAEKNVGQKFKSQLERHCNCIKDKLENDLKELDSDNFLIKNNIIFKKFIEFRKYYFLKRKISYYENEEEYENENYQINIENKVNNSKDLLASSENNNKNYNINQIQSFNIERQVTNQINPSNTYISKSNSTVPNINNEDSRIFSDYMDKIKTFLEDFSKKKENQNDLIYHRVFADEKTYMEKFVNSKAIVDFKNRNEFKKSFFLLLFDNIIDYDKKCENLSYEYEEKSQNSLENLVKIFKIDPEFCQNILLEEKNKENSIKLMEEMIRNNLPCLFQILFMEYNVINTNEEKSNYRNIFNILEFIRLHCENHNRIFQTYLCYFDMIDPRRQEDGSNFYLINYILKIFKLIYDFVNFKIKKKEILQFFGLKEIHFFDKILGKIVEFLVEVFQGNFSKNFDFLVSGEYDFSIFLENFIKTFDEINTTELEIISTNFMTFYLSLLEDYDMKNEKKNAITKKLNLKLVLQTIIYCVKKCKKNFVDKDKNLNNNNKTNNNDINNNEINIEENEEIDMLNTIPENTANELLEIYKVNKNGFSEFHLFKLMTKCYILLKILADLNNSKAADILNNLKEVYNNFHIFRLNKKDRNYSYNIQKYEIYKLLSSLVKNVEINFTREKSLPIKDENYLKEIIPQDILISIDEAEKENEAESDDIIIKPVNFLIHNESLFLGPEDLNNFQDKIPIDNYNSKLYDFVCNIPEIINVLKFKKRLYSYNSKFILMLSNLNYKVFEFISVILVLAINIMMQWTMKFDNIENNKTTEYAIIINLSVANIIFLAFVIFNYMFFKFLALERKNDKNFLLEFLGNLFNEEISFLLWNMIIGIVGVSNPICNFLFSLQLFSIISFFDTMKTILMTIKLRWKQFSSTAVLIIILVIFFTGISFYFIRDHYLLQDINLNVCQNYIYCFLTNFSYGVRLGGGIGDLLGLVKYDDPKFWALFLYQWIFFFSIVLIMLNIINGIIVDTFQDLREKNNSREEIRNNECYICGKKRMDFQIKMLDFEEHKKDEHNIHNYIYYLIRINEMDEQDLNSVDYQSLLFCRKKQTSFFPMGRCISLKENKE